MPIEQSQIISILKNIYLFHGLDEQRLEQVTRYFTQESLEPDQIIIRENQPGQAFYILLEGEVIVSRKINDVDTQIDVLVAGDFFGEEALLLNRLTSATVTASSRGTVLKADFEHFSNLIQDYPDIRRNLERVIRSRQFIRTHRFDWLNEDEVIYQVSRKHVAYLAITLLLPALVFLVGLFLFLYQYQLQSDADGAVRVILSLIAGLVMAGGVLWGVWQWIDWSNDYYIVTSQRVVWIEKVIFFYESRVEAPMGTIRSVNVNTDLLGRILGYGDVAVDTYVGRVPLRTVADPYQMAALIQEHLRRAQVSLQREEREETERSVNRILGRGEVSPPPKSRLPLPPSVGEGFREPGFFRTYFGNIFDLRIEKDNTITYRKHWLVLIRKTWQPALAFLAVVSGMLACLLSGFYNNWEDYLTIEVFVALGISLILLVLFPWWLYNYVDWRNDIYQVTDQNIFDIEKKPLGTEIRKSASLDQIISLEHTRPGFIGYLFNVGTVIINVGFTKFDFVDVHEPARIQQDIFDRMRQLRLRQQKEQAARERERVLTILSIYHQNVHGTQKENPAG
jgi:hypothetical protein